VPWNNNENKASIFGLRSALQHCTERFAAVLACDMPFVTVDVFKRLWGEIDALETDQADVILPSDKRGWLQPLCAIYERDRTRVAVDAYLETGELQMRGLIGRLRAHVINAANFEDLENAGFLFVNINTPQDMAEAVRMLDK
jgi:molybdopterin-guanine dinucleotide biosynthesis protein A